MGANIQWPQLVEAAAVLRQETCSAQSLCQQLLKHLILKHYFSPWLYHVWNKIINSKTSYIDGRRERFGFVTSIDH